MQYTAHMVKQTVSLRLDPIMRDAIKAWGARQPAEMNMAQVVRYALQRLLQDSGDLSYKVRRPHVRKRIVSEVAPDVAVSQDAEKETSDV